MFSGKVVIVTGGTRGIGRSIVLEFLRQDANVVAIYLKDDAALQKIKDNLSSKNAKRFFSYKGSISDTSFLNTFYQEVRRKFCRLDVLVNNAGVNRDNLFLEMSEDEWDSVINTNVKGTLSMSLFASEIMKGSKGKKHVINISSISGVFGRAGQANYACSKGAIIGITKLLAKKLARDNVNVNAIICGLIKTEMMDVMPKEKASEIIDATVLKRAGDPEEIAKVVLFLASDNSSYISGTSIKVDGGFLK